MIPSTIQRLAATFAALLISGPAIAVGADALTSLNPEEAYPDKAPALTRPGPYAETVKQVQQKLHELGFDAGPVTGDSTSKTQAAIAQFQLSRALPVSGMLDWLTLAELGVEEAEL